MAGQEGKKFKVHVYTRSQQVKLELNGKKAWQGICLVIIRPEKTPGKISVRATADGLKEA